MINNSIYLLHDDLNLFFNGLIINEIIDDEFLKINIKILNKLIKKLNKFKDLITYINNKKINYV